jgi:hypothetical protein
VVLLNIADIAKPVMNDFWFDFDKWTHGCLLFHLGQRKEKKRTNGQRVWLTTKDVSGWALVRNNTEAWGCRVLCGVRHEIYIIFCTYLIWWYQTHICVCWIFAPYITFLSDIKLFLHDTLLSLVISNSKNRLINWSAYWLIDFLSSKFPNRNMEWFLSD